MAGVQTGQTSEHTQLRRRLAARRRSNATTITRAAPTIASTASPSVNLGGGQITDSAVVSGRVAPVEGATIDFRLYDPDDVTCAGTPVFESLGVPYPAAGGAVTSAPFTPTKTGAYRWIAAYSGDANNLPVSGTCDAANESVLVHPAAPGTFPNLPPGAGGTAGYCFGRPATIIATGQKTINGTAGADVIIGGPAGETINGRGGNDLICAGRGNDKVSGGSGNDKIRGEAGNDKLSGDSGADLLLGSGGADDLRGGAGNDRAAGGDGTDRIDGGAGDDELDDQKLGGGGKRPDPRRDRQGPHPHGGRGGRRGRLRRRARHAPARRRRQAAALRARHPRPGSADAVLGAPAYRSVSEALSNHTLSVGSCTPV